MESDNFDILLVEDNVDDIELTRRALKKNKILNPMFVVRDGQEALNFIFHKGKYTDRSKAPLPGLILLDLKLPCVDGIEVLKALKKEPVLKRIPIVMLTTSEREEDIIESYELGVNSYITKPVEFDKFSETIKIIKLYWSKTNIAPIL